MKKKCNWCYKEFETDDKDQMCCCEDCKSKYYNFLANDNVETPWSKGWF